MRDANEMPTVEYDGEKYKIINLGALPSFDLPDYDLTDDKQLNKYMDSIKKIVRGSWEYSRYVKFLRMNMEMNQCGFYENINNADTFKIKIHIHHEPFTLPNVISIVFNKRVANRELLAENMVAKEVMFLHYLMMVGLIPLSETVHELVHNNYLYIPMDKVLGYVDKFIDSYGAWIDPDLRDMYERNLEFTRNYNENLAKNIHLLEKKPIYVDASGAYDLPPLQTVIDFMNDKIKSIRSAREEENKPKLIQIMTRVK